MEGSGIVSFSLSKLAYVLTALAVVAYFNSHYLGLLLIGDKADYEALMRIVNVGYPVESLVTLIALLGGLTAWGRFRSLFNYRLVTRRKLKVILVGLSAGVAAAVFAGLGHNSDAAVQRGILVRALLFNPE